MSKRRGEPVGQPAGPHPVRESAQLFHRGLAFRVVGDFCAGLRWPLTISVGRDTRTAVQGVRLVADDVNWSHGTGPEVHDWAGSLLMVLTGRTVAVDELTGPGAERFARGCGRRPPRPYTRLGHRCR